MIKILLHGEKHHVNLFKYQIDMYCAGKLICEVCDDIENADKLKKFDIVHLVSSPLPLIRKLAKYKLPVIYHWIGTDVYRIINDHFIKRWFKKILISYYNVHNLVVVDWLNEELKQIGIYSEILPLINPEFTDNCAKLPEKFSVLCYVPENRWDFYNGNLILDLAGKLPDIDFNILAADSINTKLKNVYTYGLINNIESFYKNSNVLLRITTHDGLSKMVLEALSNCRHVIWNQRFPFCHHAQNFDECLTTLQSLKLNPSLNKEGMDYIESNYNPEKISGDYLIMIRKILNRQ